jgi:predicted transcriptional regulator
MYHYLTLSNLVKDVIILISDKLSKSEINVLQVLQKSNIINESSAVKISTLAEKTNLSYYTVRNIIKSLYIAGLCSKGRKDGNGETYYLTNLGQETQKNIPH